MRRCWLVGTLVVLVVTVGILWQKPPARASDSYDVLGKDGVILSVRAQVAGLDLISRGQVIEKRMLVVLNHPGVFDSANFKVVRLKTGVRGIFFRSQPLVSVFWQDARASNTASPKKLAKIWLGNLRQELPKMTTYRLWYVTHNK